jgi:cytochrome c-type biogenesis protein CcmH/NrfF
MLWLWFGLVVLWAVGLILLARWMRRRQDETLPTESTLTEAERAEIQLGIAMSAANTMTSPH